MTLPSRPAPAPPGSRAQNAAATANASLEQLRLQLQQQQQLQRQNVTVPKLTIKLPPPPKGPHPTTAHNGFGTTNNNTNAVAGTGGGGSITRKFPQARYAPATNWDDSPFDALTGGVSNGTSASNTNNGNYKKPPPPRPPPPKVQPKKPSAPSAPVQSSSILSNIFHRKKSARVPTSTAASRVYGAATYGTTTTITSTSSSTTSTSQMSIFNQATWNNAWNTTPNCVSAQSTQSTTTEGQLISFDSPPSSPTFTQKSNSDCLSVDSFSSDSNFSSPNNGSVSQPESGFEDDFSATARTRPATTSPIDPWETLDTFGQTDTTTSRYGIIGTAPVRNLNVLNTRLPNNSPADNPLCNGKSLLPPAPTLNMPTIIKPKISQKPKAPRPPNLTHPNGGATLYSDNLCTPPSPPMPQCAPPPPPPPTQSLPQSVAGSLGYSHAAMPSLLDVISGKVDALHLYPGGGVEPVDEQPYGIALYDFNSTEDGDLCFRENEKIYLLEQVSEEWYKGRTRSGCEGIFPVNYIEIKVPLNNQQTTTITTQSPPGSLFASSVTSTYQTNRISSNSSSNSAAYKLQVKSLYNFPAEVQGDLELKENDLVTILYRINEDWLYGEINGLQGQFPANFLEYVPSNIPMP